MPAMLPVYMEKWIWQWWCALDPIPLFCSLPGPFFSIDMNQTFHAPVMGGWRWSIMEWKANGAIRGLPNKHSTRYFVPIYSAAALTGAGVGLNTGSMPALRSNPTLGFMPALLLSQVWGKSEWVQAWKGDRIKCTLLLSGSWQLILAQGRIGSEVTTVCSEISAYIYGSPAHKNFKSDPEVMSHDIVVSLLPVPVQCVPPLNWILGT